MKQALKDLLQKFSILLVFFGPPCRGHPKMMSLTLSPVTVKTIVFAILDFIGDRFLGILLTYILSSPVIIFDVIFEQPKSLSNQIPPDEEYTPSPNTHQCPTMSLPSISILDPPPTNLELRVTIT